MRDVAAHDKHELQRTQKEMETLKTSLAELGRERDRFRSRAEEMETSIADLQEQVGVEGSPTCRNRWEMRGRRPAGTGGR